MPWERIVFMMNTRRGELSSRGGPVWDSAEPVAVSAFVGSSKNLNDLKDSGVVAAHFGRDSKLQLVPGRHLFAPKVSDCFSCALIRVEDFRLKISGFGETQVMYRGTSLIRERPPP